MALDVDGVAGEAVVLAAEEPVEADVVERRRGGEGRQVPADAVGVLVGLDDHDRGVPADVGADAALEVLVAGEPGLLLGRDGVDVRRRHRGRRAHLELAGPLEQLGHQEPGAGLAVGVDHRIERVEPFAGLGGVGVRELVDEPIDDHEPMLAPAGPIRNESVARSAPPRGVGTVRPGGTDRRVGCPRARDPHDVDHRVHRRRLPPQPRSRRLGLGRGGRCLRVAVTSPAPPTSAWRSPPPTRRCAPTPGRSRW